MRFGHWVEWCCTQKIPVSVPVFSQVEKLSYPEQRATGVCGEGVRIGLNYTTVLPFTWTHLQPQCEWIAAQSGAKMFLWILPVLVLNFLYLVPANSGLGGVSSGFLRCWGIPGPPGDVGTAMAPLPLHGAHTQEAPGICSPWKSWWRQEGKSQPVFNENLYSVRQIPGKSEKVLRCPLRLLFYLFAFHSNGTDFIWSSQLFYGGGLRWKQGVNSGCTRASGALDTGTVRNIDPPGNEEYISNLWGIFYSILRRPVS